MKIYIVRHGETDYNLNGIVQGSGVDSSLNETGREQARHFHDKYKNEGFELVITSGLRRTQETVQGFIDDGIPWEVHPEITEMSWGEHEGKSGTPESIAEFNAIKRGWSEGAIDGRVGGGESARELSTRLQRFIDHLPDRPESKILICSHGRAMCGLVTLLLGEHISRMNEHTHNNLGLWIGELKPEGHYEFHLRNDRSHLPGPVKPGKW
ncbi:putative phosphoglycerate mutase [Lewinella aquimaris]|uniref:Putative phosphoglycerate mutase n=1 Tax=Neolewinella aquimaris TaxID=1835722 RepID=A0A840E9E3_9BACT|nr:histidine phosphatase family protein [Neolewinella aquimaris]MBB4080342.1 putative phosphoglycerate mutase [Neolewinella aquimaris]